MKLSIDYINNLKLKIDMQVRKEVVFALKRLDVGYVYRASCQRL